MAITASHGGEESGRQTEARSEATAWRGSHAHPLWQGDDDKQVLEAIGHEPSPGMVLMMEEFVESFFPS